MRRLAPILPLSLAAMLAVAAFPATADPSYWRVVGVAADDMLNVRAGPSAATEDIGDLPPGTGGIEIAAISADGGWGRLLWQEGDGWVAMRYLAPDPQPGIGDTDLPAGLLCTGTEPFWSLRLSPASASYSDLEGLIVTLPMTDARVALGRADAPVLLGHVGTGAGSLAVIAPRTCSDGMSARSYPWRIDYVLDSAAGRRFVTGCCRLPLEAGEN